MNAYIQIIDLSVQYHFTHPGGGFLNVSIQICHKLDGNLATVWKWGRTIVLRLRSWGREDNKLMHARHIKVNYYSCCSQVPVSIIDILFRNKLTVIAHCSRWPSGASWNYWSLNTRSRSTSSMMTPSPWTSDSTSASGLRASTGKQAGMKTAGRLLLE